MTYSQQKFCYQEPDQFTEGSSHHTQEEYRLREEFGRRESCGEDLGEQNTQKLFPERDTLSPKGKSCNQRGTISAAQDFLANRSQTKGSLVTGHTISFNAEIDKVREESQKKIADLRSFYEDELIKMR
mmetsp:Transcript_10141/g.10104  ORF Transcript_10141/g.10104 Transcript_10141/m.10104 type:complete len:128 (+) Transcript_10141:1804-2187(+)